MTSTNAPRSGSGDARAEGKGGRAGRNLALLKTRLRRRRVPAAGSGGPWRGILIYGLITAVLVAILGLALDASAVAWAEDLSKGWKLFFKAITRFGKSEWPLVPSGLLVILLLAGDWTRTDRKVAAAAAEIATLAGFFFVAVAEGGARHRPRQVDFRAVAPELFATDGVLTLNLFSFDASSVSFPSGHATTVSAIVVAVALMMRRRVNPLTVLLGVGAAVICVSRVAVLAHFPSDVVGAGIFVGSSFTLLVAWRLGRSGVGFQRQADGSLRAKTDAVRGLMRQTGGFGRLWRGLVAAVFGPR